MAKQKSLSAAQKLKLAEETIAKLNREAAEQAALLPLIARHLNAEIGTPALLKVFGRSGLKVFFGSGEEIRIEKEYQTYNSQGRLNPRPAEKRNRSRS